MRHWLILTGLLLNLAFTPLAPPTQIEVTDNQAAVEFPDRITFSVALRSTTTIERVILEYGVGNQLTCGKVIAKAFPALTPGNDTQGAAAQWTWEMRKSGSEPPGAEVWWQWRITDSAGNEQVTEKQTVTWLDAEHPWQTKSGGDINLHWYEGNASFAGALHASAVASLKALAQDTGLEPDQPIDLYIYGSTDDMREAILYEPGWTGGLAYPNYNIVIIGIAPRQLDWGKRTQAHELTHVLVGHLTFSCLSIMPTWLNEGLAVYGEGGLEADNARQLQEAIAANQLLSVRSLSGSFAENRDRALLSYSESYSLVNFLITNYGRDKMLELLRAIRDGDTVDAALQETYGFNIEGLENAWRADVGAAALTADQAATATATATPTIVPTFPPIAGVPSGATTQPEPTGTPPPTPPPTIPPPPPVEFTPPAIPGERSLDPALFGYLTGACLLLALCFIALGGAAIAFILSRRRQPR